MTKDNWIKAYSKIMLEWIESQWKIESAHQAGEPYTRMKFEAEASKVEDKLKNLISQVEKDARKEGYEEGWNNAVNMDEWETRLQDAIEKTNKRWEQAIKLTGEDEDVHITYSCNVCGGVGEFMTKLRKNLSDLLEDK